MFDSIPNVLETREMTANEGPDELARRVRSLRERAGWSQETLAERSGLSQTAVSKMENGPNVAPRLSTLRKLATALAVPVESLTGDAAIPGAPLPIVAPVEDSPLELAIFRALSPSKHKPAAFDAARRAAREASASLPQTDVDQLAVALLDAAAALLTDGHALTTVGILARVIASNPPKPTRAR
jgi:transcriptional regulator with XRE-family HTH domain